MSFNLVERVCAADEEGPNILIANISSEPDVEKNLNKMEQVIELAHQKKVDILIFPELTVTGYVWEARDQTPVWELLAAGENKKIEKRLNHIRDSLSEAAGSLEYIIFGNAWEKEGRYYNCTFVLNPATDYWQEEFIYTKVFLPPAERAYFSPGGGKRLSIDTKWGRFGFLICYDLCFTELARRYALDDDVDALFVIAAWRAQKEREYDLLNIKTDHYYGFLWDMMSAAQAAFSQAWVIGANWVGRQQKSGHFFWGGSGLWAPSGLKLLQASKAKEELLLVYNLDLKKQRQLEKADFDYRADFKKFYRGGNITGQR